MSAAGQIASRLAALRDRVSEAALAAGRDPSEVRIIAVTKRMGAQAVLEAYEAGQRDFGENYVQEAVAKMAEVAPAAPEARWHFLGRLQSNKAAVAEGRFALLHGMDSLRAVAAVSRAALGHGRVADVLLQVRLGGGGATGSPAQASRPDGSRAGVAPEAAGDFLGEACRHEGVRFTGLMGVADPDQAARPQFAGLRELSARLARAGHERAPLGELSMGMTGDFADAIAEGATLVRIGTAIFGQRT